MGTAPPPEKGVVGCGNPNAMRMRAQVMGPTIPSAFRRPFCACQRATDCANKVSVGLEFGKPNRDLVRAVRRSLAGTEWPPEGRRNGWPHHLGSHAHRIRIAAADDAFLRGWRGPHTFAIKDASLGASACSSAESISRRHSFVLSPGLDQCGIGRPYRRNNPV